MGDDKTSGSDLSSLNELFGSGFNLYLEIEKSTESANEKTYQDKVREATAQFENATHLVNEIGIFSENEELDEVSTRHLKYDDSFSKTILNLIILLLVRQVYFRDFLTRCRNYGVTSYELPEAKDDDSPEEKPAASPKKSETDNLLDACRKRKEKIARFTEQKAMEERQRQLKDLISNATADDEVVREYYTVLLKYWVNNAIEELRSIEEEKPILQYMAKMKAQGKPTHEASTQQQPKKPLRPIIITRNELQKQVYGAGYPSIPSMTVDEFYAKRYPKLSEQESSSAEAVKPLTRCDSPVPSMSPQQRRIKPNAAAISAAEYARVAAASLGILGPCDRSYNVLVSEARNSLNIAVRFHEIVRRHFGTHAKEERNGMRKLTEVDSANKAFAISRDGGDGYQATRYPATCEGTSDEQGWAVATRVPALIYADDIALLAHSPDELQALLDICGDTMATLYLRFNPQKCSVMGDVKVAVSAVSIRQLVRQQEREEWVRTAGKKSSMTVYMMGKGDIAKEAFFDNSRGSGLLAEARSGVLRTRHWKAHYVDGQQTQCILCNAAEETIEHIVLQCPKIHPPSETTSLETALSFVEGEDQRGLKAVGFRTRASRLDGNLFDQQGQRLLYHGALGKLSIDPLTEPPGRTGPLRSCPTDAYITDVSPQPRHSTPTSTSTKTLGSGPEPADSMATSSTSKDDACCTTWLWWSLQDWAADPEKASRELEEEEAQKEQLIEADDKAALEYKRAMDDWKDGKPAALY
ncbi:hypothetical protein HPB52_022839 [Rhipicephalus sanguineus]|uniref:Uncharacterized protein n=1 Tax=Rhipicephalus sanguineus TaxID=34632 RepID=A0A9D4PSZ4_RHISA|nr:hypothetical protein HPB52_022839 [Rhipicephalus sanguineus]